MLLQKGQLVIYTSRKWKIHEKEYLTYDLELMIIKCVCLRFGVSIKGGGMSGRGK